MENILLDESYSFSLRQFEQQKSKRGDLQQMSVENPYFEQSRMSNMSAYAQNMGGDSNRGGRVSVPATDQRPSSSKVVSLIASHEFRPFSKPRKSKNIAMHDDRGGISKLSHNNQWMPSSTIHSVQDSSHGDDDNDEPHLAQKETFQNEEEDA